METATSRACATCSASATIARRSTSDFSTRRRFDLVVASQSLHFLDDPPQVVRTARKLLKKGGRLLVLELLPHGEEWVRERLGHRYLGFDPVELAATLEAEGFASIITEILPSGS